LGELLKAIEKEKQEGLFDVKRVYIGIGGTATIDMGLGMMSELGLSLLDSDGKEINVIPENLKFAEQVNRLPDKLSFEVIPIVDVSNPLLGKDGGIKSYGLQKGAKENSILIIENNFTHILNLFINKGLKVSSHKLSGAGGGIPTAFQIFYNSRLLKASEFILNNLGVGRFLDEVDFVITGEGAYDHQSNFGKGAGIIIDKFDAKVKTIFLVCGKIDSESIFKLPKNVKPIELRQYFQNDDESMKNYGEGIKKATKEIIKEVNFNILSRP
jgi:glycerate kinase